MILASTVLGILRRRRVRIRLTFEAVGGTTKVLAPACVCRRAVCPFLFLSDSAYRPFLRDRSGRRHTYLRSSVFICGSSLSPLRPYNPCQLWTTPIFIAWVHSQPGIHRESCTLSGQSFLIFGGDAGVPKSILARFEEKSTGRNKFMTFFQLFVAFGSALASGFPIQLFRLVSQLGRISRLSAQFCTTGNRRQPNHPPNPNKLQYLSKIGFEPQNRTVPCASSAGVRFFNQPHPRAFTLHSRIPLLAPCTILHNPTLTPSTHIPSNSHKPLHLSKIG